MRKSSKLLFAGLTAALILSLAVGSASARSLRLDEQRFNAKWAGLNFIAGGRTVSCRVTLEGSFHSSTISKVEEALVGFVSRAAVAGASCTGGSATVLAETLPWHLRYAGFEGILPEIEEIFVRLVGASFSVKPTGSLTCLAATTATNPARGIISRELLTGAITGLAADRNSEIPLRGEGGLCAFGGRGHFEGTGTVERLAGGTIHVTLI